MSDDLIGTFICPLCGQLIDVTVTITTVPLEVDGSPSFTTVTAPQYTHTCPTRSTAQAAPDG